MTTTTKGKVRPSRRSVPSLRAALLAAMLTGTVVAATASPVPAGADARSGAPGLAYEATKCTESVALVTLPRSVLEAQVDLPHPFTVGDFAPGVGLLLVAVASCDSISVNGKPARPGRFSDVGVMIEAPDGTGGQHFYQLWQVSDHEDLVLLMAKVGVATDDAGVWFEKTSASAMGTVISELSSYRVSVLTSPPEKGDRDGGNTWWHDGAHGTVRIANHGHGVGGNFGGYVLELAADSSLAQMLGTKVLSGAGAAMHFAETRGELSLYKL